MKLLLKYITSMFYVIAPFYCRIVEFKHFDICHLEKFKIMTDLKFFLFRVTYRSHLVKIELSP